MQDNNPAKPPQTLIPFVLGTAASAGDFDLCRACRVCSGFGVVRLSNPGSPMRDAMRSGMKSGVVARESMVYSVSWVDSVSGVARRWRAVKSGEGERERSGYSVAGVARSRREVVGCGERIVEPGNSSVTMVVGTVAGPVRTWEGRICSKPWARATCSMSLKY